MSVKPLAVLDTECYRDYWLCSIRRLDTGALRIFEQYPGKSLDVIGLRETLSRVIMVTFNGRRYDAPMIGLALTGVSCDTLKRCSDFIIQLKMNAWDAERQFNFRTPEFNHIDMIDVVPGMVSLKVYMGRLHCPRLQDLPIEHSASIEPEQRDLIKQYNVNDLDGTEALYRKFEKQIELRREMSREYGIDLRSKSDAQIAESVIKAKLGVTTRPEVNPHTFKFRFPNYLRHAGPIVQGVIDQVRAVDFEVKPNGYVEMPPELAKLRIRIGASEYRMGIGGLHSCEKSVAHVAGNGMMLIDRDVASYYPAIVINTGLYPRHLGKPFLDLYRQLRDERLEAKHAGLKAKADSLKITLNGAFGKLGNPYSILYSPELLIQVTLTGQLTLLMLIEWIESDIDSGISVVSANTDGIVISCHEDYYDLLCATIKHWEQVTGYETEETRYRALYSRDVNSYIALKEGGGVKLKGAYSESEPVASSWSSPHNQICVKAACDYLEHGIPVDLTIRTATDIRDFVELRNVTGGAVWRGEYLGRAARWYKAIGGEEITYKKNGNKVANSDGARPLMVMDGTMPADLDLDAYIKDANEILEDIGAI